MNKGADVPGGENHHVRRQLASVLELKPRLGELSNLAVVLNLDLPVDDELARADVYIIVTRWIGTKNERCTHRYNTRLRDPTRTAQTQSPAFPC